MNQFDSEKFQKISIPNLQSVHQSLEDNDGFLWTIEWFEVNTQKNIDKITVLNKTNYEILIVEDNTNLRQYTDTLTMITDVACANPSCFPTSTKKTNLTNIDTWFANNQLYINNEKHQLLQVYFINVQGQVVYITTSKNNNDVISFEHLPKGIYFVLLQDPKGQSTRKVGKY
ncbi:MAG: T9SS type A sorting domain-containing protein [Saprospiraceae bacterium]